MHFRNVLFLGLLAVGEHRHSHCCQERLLSDVLGGQAGGGLSPSDLLQIAKFTHWHFQPLVLAILLTPEEHLDTPCVDPEKEEKPLALLALPLCFPGSWFWLRLSLQALLLKQNFPQYMQVTRDFSQSLTAWPSILRLQGFFSPRFIFAQRLPQGSSYSN